MPSTDQTPTCCRVSPSPNARLHELGGGRRCPSVSAAGEPGPRRNAEIRGAALPLPEPSAILAPGGSSGPGSHPSSITHRARSLVRAIPVGPQARACAAVRWRLRRASSWPRTLCPARPVDPLITPPRLSNFAPTNVLTGVLVLGGRPVFNRAPRSGSRATPRSAGGSAGRPFARLAIAGLVGRRCCGLLSNAVRPFFSDAPRAAPPTVFSAPPEAAQPRVPLPGPGTPAGDDVMLFCPLPGPGPPSPGIASDSSAGSSSQAASRCRDVPCRPDAPPGVGRLSSNAWTTVGARRLSWCAGGNPASADARACLGLSRQESPLRPAH